MQFTKDALQRLLTKSIIGETGVTDIGLLQLKPN